MCNGYNLIRNTKFRFFSPFPHGTGSLSVDHEYLALTDDPSVLNDDTMNEGWMIRIEMDTEKELANLMRAPDYKKLIAEK